RPRHCWRQSKATGIGPGRQWMPQGAHLREQTRAQTLDGTLRGRFENRYPGLAANDPEISSTTTATAAAAVGRGGSDVPRFFMLLSRITAIDGVVVTLF